MVYIDDVVEMMIKGINLNVGEKYIVVGENIKIGDVFDKVCRIIGKEPITKITPGAFLILISYFSELVSFFTKKRPSLPVDGLKAIKIGASASSQKSINKLEMKYLNADQILSKSIEWYKENNFIND